MKKRLSILLLFCSLLFFNEKIKAQQDSCQIEISLLTCTPGEELYSTFGHSAIRVQDASTGMDIVFNYGTFDFDDPRFYSKFVKGQLLYFVSTSSLEEFLYEYQYFKRGVTEQILHINCEQKQQLIAALLLNSKEENRYYYYNFTHDNCTSRLRDLLYKNINDSITIKNILPHHRVSFRNLIHEYLDKGNQHWSKLGIDIILGSPLDKKIDTYEAMFLPDYLMKALDSATIHSQSLVKEKKELLPSFTKTKTGFSFFQPIYVFTVILLFIALLSFTRLSKQANKIVTIFDFVFFLLLGSIGVLLLFMWFGTQHPMANYNYNLLWASPIHLISAFYILKNNSTKRKYFLFIFVYTLSLLLAWYFIPQKLNPALIFVTGITLIRSYYLLRKR